MAKRLEIITLNVAEKDKVIKGNRGDTWRIKIIECKDNYHS